MVVPEPELQKARDMLQAAARPLFLYDNDCDGVSSFVLGYQFCKEGRGVPVKPSPYITEDYVRRLAEYSPDLVVILDIGNVSEDFLSQTQTPVLWIDHHEPQEIAKRFPNVHYINPRKWDDNNNLPTIFWMYQITKLNLWLAVVGIVADWHLPPEELLCEFRKHYADLLPEKFETQEDLYLDTPIGLLIRILQFNFKGSTNDVRKSVLTLTRITSAYEILKKTTPRGRFLWKKYAKLEAMYGRHMLDANKAAEEPGNILLYAYYDGGTTFTSDLSNELLIRYSEKVIIVARKHDEKYKCSLRSKHIEIADLLAEALKGIHGHGGGHKHACGAVIPEDEWDQFYGVFSKLVDKRIKEVLP